jgi:tRNA-dihydrouridine synthase 4
MHDGLGACLIERPELVADMCRQTRAALGDRAGTFSVSIKIRLRPDIERTVDLCRQVCTSYFQALFNSLHLQAEAAGVSYISVHARTAQQRSSAPVDMDAVRTLRDSVHIPIVHNGDIMCMRDVHELYARTRCHGVMYVCGVLSVGCIAECVCRSARGMLANPALFADAAVTPAHCVRDWVDEWTRSGHSLSMYHHHLMFMLDRQLCHTELCTKRCYFIPR